MVTLLGRDEALAQVHDVLRGPRGSVVIHGEAGVGKSALAAVALTDVDHRAGGALGTLSWLPYLALRRALPDLPDATWSGDVEFVARQVEAAVGDSVLLVEDLHWAGEATLTVVRRLLARVSMVLSVRRGAPSSSDVLAALAAAGVVRIDLEPLGSDDARELVRHRRPELAEHDVDSVLARSGGNPLIIEELLGGDEPSLARSLLARCELLPEEQRDGLALLVLAQQALPVSEVPGAEGLVEAGMVVVADGRVRIRHDLVAEVIEPLLEQDRRVRSHRLLARLMDHPGDRARHLLAAGEPQAAHVEALRAVAEATLPGERWRHLAVAAETATGPERETLSFRAIEAASRAGEPGAAARIVEQLSGADSAAAALARATHAYELGDGDDFLGHVRRGLELVAPGSVEEVHLLVELASGLKEFEHEPRQGLEVALDAVDRATRAGLSVGPAAKVVADCLIHGGDRGWQEWYERALAAALADGDTHLEIGTAHNLVYGLLSEGEVSRGRRLAERMAARCAELRLAHWVHAFESYVAMFAVGAGDHDHVLREVPRLVAASSRPRARRNVIAILAVGLAEVGRIAESLEELEALAGDDAHQALYRAARIFIFSMAADLDAVLAEWSLLLEAPDLDCHLLADSVVPVAWAAWESGRTVDLPDIEDRPVFAGMGPELDGIAALRQGRHADAAALFEQAARGHRGHHRRHEVHCAWAAAEARRLAGDPTAEAALEAALDLAVASGMVATEARCERSLRAVGVRRPFAPRPAGSPLSAREHEVVLLATEGLTDREIAARLGIAHRTVQTHVASARAKVGALNRTQLVAVVGGAGT